MPKPGSKNLDLYQGDDFDFTFRLKNADDTYKNLTDYTGLAQIRPSKSSSTVLATFAVIIPVQTEITMGTVTISLTEAQTAALTPNEGTGTLPVWDVELRGGTPPRKRTWLAGNVNIYADTSREP